MPEQSIERGIAATPFFLDAPAGRVFAVHHTPSDRSAIRGHVLWVPPFNEEMNRCRSMVTLQALAFARLGLGTLVIDLHGTGDSEGEFSEGRWSVWLDDLRAAHAWLCGQSGGCRGIVGVRLGAILASQLHAELSDARIALVLWQPVVDGKLHLTQFLRVKMAAQLDRPGLNKETTASMRKQFSEGQSVEVAGYDVHPELARAIDEARLIAHVPADGAPILWLENAGADSTELSPPSRAAFASWSSQGVAVDARFTSAWWLPM
jgi:exosortase A-associated hydrolase 2